MDSSSSIRPLVDRHWRLWFLACSSGEASTFLVSFFLSLESSVSPKSVSPGEMVSLTCPLGAREVPARCPAAGFWSFGGHSVSGNQSIGKVENQSRARWIFCWEMRSSAAIRAASSGEPERTSQPRHLRSERLATALSKLNVANSSRPSGWERVKPKPSPTSLLGWRWYESVSTSRDLLFSY